MGARVLLIWPNSLNEVLGWGDLGAIAEPLALEYLGAALKAAGHDVELLDLRLHRDALADRLAAFKPDLVGVTAFSMHVRRAITICNEVKQHDWRIQTIVGGHHATFLPEDFFVDSIDFVCSGDGTAPIVAVANAVVEPQQLGAVDGLYVRRDDGSFAATAARSNLLTSDALDALLPPDRTLTEGDRTQYFIDAMKPVALLRTSVGCPYRCSFCSVWRVFEGHYHLRSIEKVVAEIASVPERDIFLVDDEAFINGKRMIALAAAIKQAGIDKRYFTYCRIDTIDRNRDAVAAWAEIGLNRLFIGIDAISAKDLDEYNKRCSIKQIEHGLAIARDLRIEVFAQFVVNTDYTPQDFKALVRFIEHSGIEYPSFTVLTPLPGTAMLASFDTVTEWQPNGRPDWNLFDCQNAVTETRLPKPEFRRRYRDLYRVFKGAYNQYRDHVVIGREELESAEGLALPVSAAVRIGNKQVGQVSIL